MGDLDFDQYTLVSEAKHYALNDGDDGSDFNTQYFEHVIYKLADSNVYLYYIVFHVYLLFYSTDLNPQKCAPRTNTELPERHFREVGSPAVGGLLIATLEIMMTPVSPSIIIEKLLDLSLLRESHHIGVSALRLHAIGLLVSLLPQKDFVNPIFTELNDLIKTDVYLLEISEPCKLVNSDN